LSNITQNATELYYVISQLDNKYAAEVGSRVQFTCIYVHVIIVLSIYKWLKYICMLQTLIRN